MMQQEPLNHLQTRNTRHEQQLTSQIRSCMEYLIPTDHIVVSV